MTRSRHKRILATVEEARKQLTRSQQEATEQQSKRDLLERQCQKAKDDSAKYLDICEISRLDLQKTKLENDKLTKELQDLTFNISTKKLELDLLHSNLKNLTETIQFSQQKSEHLQNEIATLEGEKGQLNKEGTMRQENGRQRVDMMDYLNKLDELQSNISAKSRALEQLNEQHNLQRESNEISQFLQQEVDRLRINLEATKSQALIDLQNLQKVRFLSYCDELIINIYS